MRGFLILFALLLLSGWGAFEIRSRDKSISNALYVICGLLVFILIVAFATGEFGD